MAAAKQIATLWPRLKDEKRFYYGGMPTGIATRPETYEKWEFTTNDQMDLAAMGRVWYLECWARAKMGDGPGLVESIRKVCRAGCENGYYWRERYTDKGAHGVEKYCEYPANLIRIVNRFLLGVEFDLDGTILLAPVAPDDFWKTGFGQTLTWRGQTLSYRIDRNHISGLYCGESPQRLCVRFPQTVHKLVARVTINGGPVEATISGDGKVVVLLPAVEVGQSCRFEIQVIQP